VSTGKRYGSVENVLNQLNEQAGRIHAELHASGDIDHPYPDVEMMDHKDRREIGRYLCNQSGLDFASSLRVIKNAGMIYDERNNRYLVKDNLIQDIDFRNGFAYLSHEAGHLHGRKVVQDRLVPMEDLDNLDQSGFDDLVDYMISENFAERVKCALGTRFGVEVNYNQELVEEPPAGYEVRSRIGPSLYVDPKRDEDVGDVFSWVDETIRDLRN